MPISKVMRAALRAISSHDPNLLQNYQRTRRLFDATHPAMPKDYTMWDRHVSLGGRDIPVRVFPPATGLPEHIIVYLHGGGWVTGGIDSYTAVCARTAREAQSLVVLVDYRLAPENPFPAGLEDCYAITKEIFSGYTTGVGLPGQSVVLMGDSAGGNLAAAVSLLAKERGEFAITKQILLYPCTYNDHSPTSPYPSVVENGTDYLLTSKMVCDYLELYMGKGDCWDDPHFAPLLATDLSGMPDTLLLTAEFCPLRDEGEAYGQKLLEAGNRVEIHRIPNAIHGYFALPMSFTPVHQSYTLIQQFLKNQ